MLNDATCFKNVYIVTGYTDLRSGIDTLAAILEDKLGRKPYEAVNAVPLYRQEKGTSPIDRKAIGGCLLCVGKTKH